MILQAELGVQVDLGNRNFRFSVKGRLEGKMSSKRLLFCPEGAALSNTPL